MLMILMHRFDFRHVQQQVRIQVALALSGWL